MAERYGGKYSPGAAKAPRRRSKTGARVNFLHIVPFVLVLTAFQQPPVGMAIDLVAFAVLQLAAWLTREGLRAEEAYEARNVAKRPAIPRKLFGSAMIGLGLALAGLDPETMSPLNPAIFAILGAILHAVSFGADPMRDKGAPGSDSFQNERVARAVDEAERHLAAMREAIGRAGVPALSRRVDAFARTAQAMFRAVEDDPRDLTGARRYLGVYLLGARDATIQFADLYAKSRNDEARRDYEALLDDLETSFSARTEKMMLDDKSSLDVEIEVLRERLAREGVRTR
ncbi:hypothetical protein GQ651_01290 [Alphaproteobacteria bacterium GH1-50]|uniref:5-bromo-4-chloroindolyl phosphate hydrolysis protein n=1 Tax=Kangsaoukella pontilimi TaxID=2691042 RepID=A0A7C9MBH1_9RHOB|nr:5-bromo-4-chloroindolyl phosphate hydrolysis family protein [Kangsaoukella pontilimi]MXQ06472.1 hypothetical protein [Kangsaoukella pontilimi]